MNAVAYKTKDGPICIAPCPTDDYLPYQIRRVVYPSRPCFVDMDPCEVCDILTREYRRTYEKHQGFPIYEEV
jgi:hypothetical protein